MIVQSQGNQSFPDPDCLFCKILRGESPAKEVYRDEQCMAFWDIYPKAPVHILIIPVKHITSINEITEEDEEIIGHLARVAAKIVKQMGIEQNGYRLIINTGQGAGQTIFHIHMHLLAGNHLIGF